MLGVGVIGVGWLVDIGRAAICTLVVKAGAIAYEYVVVT